MKLTSGTARVAQRLLDLGAGIDTSLHVSEIRSLAEVFKDNIRGIFVSSLMLGSGALSVLLLAAARIYSLRRPELVKLWAAIEHVSRRFHMNLEPKTVGE